MLSLHHLRIGIPFGELACTSNYTPHQNELNSRLTIIGHFYNPLSLCHVSLLLFDVLAN